MSSKYKKILLLVILLSAVFLFFVKVQAVGIDLGLDIADKIARTATYEDDKDDSEALSKRVGKVVNIALTMLGVVFLLLTFYAGYLWMFAQGEEEPIEKSKKILTTSVIGILVIVSAYSITNLVVGQLIERTINSEIKGEGGYGCCLRYYKVNGVPTWGGVIVKNEDECVMTGWEVSGCRGGVDDCGYFMVDVPEECADEALKRNFPLIDD
jgi:hypothetical protein